MFYRIKRVRPDEFFKVHPELKNLTTGLLCVHLRTMYGKQFPLSSVRAFKGEKGNLEVPVKVLPPTLTAEAFSRFLNLFYKLFWRDTFSAKPQGMKVVEEGKLFSYKLGEKVVVCKWNNPLFRHWQTVKKNSKGVEETKWIFSYIGETGFHRIEGVIIKMLRNMVDGRVYSHPVSITSASGEYTLDSDTTTTGEAIPLATFRSPGVNVKVTKPHFSIQDVAINVAVTLWGMIAEGRADSISDVEVEKILTTHAKNEFLSFQRHEAKRFSMLGMGDVFELANGAFEIAQQMEESIAE